MKLVRQKLLLFFILIVIAAAISACSRTEKFTAVSVNQNGVALKGFDAVAYFAAEKAVQGNSTYEFAWNGAKWLFSNAENLERFSQNPEAYAPQFGGYCSFAVSKGYTADGDPTAWKIVDGKLYLNYNQDVKETWENHQPDNINKAEDNWAEFQSAVPEHKK